MVIARRTLKPEKRVPCAYHLTSRCVRKKFLLQDENNRRQEMAEKLLLSLIKHFSIDLCAYAIMGNHFHCVIIERPDQAAELSDIEVATRWCALVKKRTAMGNTAEWTQSEIENLANNPEWVAEQRERLSSMSWLMRLFKQRLARRFNKEDDTKGHFWEGRFFSKILPDQQALIECMIYNDLNPIRAGSATLPELSNFTSIQRRITVHQEHSLAVETTKKLSKVQKCNDEQFRKEMEHAKWRSDRGPKFGLVILPAIECTAPGPYTVHSMTEKEYITIVEAYGRFIANGKRGSIDRDAKPIFERLGLEIDQLTEQICETYTSPSDTANISTKKANHPSLHSPQKSNSIRKFSTSVPDN